MSRCSRTGDGFTVFWCPGCDMHHVINDGWTITGTPDSPTFSPSVLVLPSGGVKRCHSFVRDGVIEFLGDCDHELRGRTVPLPDLETVRSESPDAAERLAALLGES